LALPGKPDLVAVREHRREDSVVKREGEGSIMETMILAVLIASLTLLVGSVSAHTTKSADRPDRILLQWTSQQQMNWDIRISAQGFRFLAAPLGALDAGGKQTLTVSPDGTSLAIDTVTGWSTGSAVVEIEPGKTGTVSIESRDPFVEDRHTKGEFSLAELQQGQAIPIHSKEWPIRNCTFRLTMSPVEVDQEAELLKTLGADRKHNVDALLACADKAESKARRLDLLLRAAAACTGGCNHGPLEPNGWDRAIAVYQKVVDENKGSDIALDAMWAQASCYACWSPVYGCDRDGIGKGDYEAACELYEKLYQISSSPSDKADALRRMAEVQCYEADDCGAGLRNYKRIAVEFPGSLPPSTHWTYRTCAPHCGTEQLAWDIYRVIVYKASDPSGVRSAFDNCFGDVKGNPHIDELAILVQEGAGARK
jgi:hypothetical protein